MRIKYTKTHVFIYLVNLYSYSLYMTLNSSPTLYKEIVDQTDVVRPDDLLILFFSFALKALAPSRRTFLYAPVSFEVRQMT